MREILFRAKRNNERNAGEWVIGLLWHYTEKAAAIYSDTLDRLCWVSRDTVGQFTGLTDKNGKKIFEGDICTYPDGWVDHAGDGVETFSVGVVTWYNEHPCFYLTNNIGVEWDEIWDTAGEITVIGNIHDNPELLRVPMEPELKNWEVLREDLKNFDHLEDFQQEQLADYIACPSSDDCQYDGVDNSCCTGCKVRWLNSKWEG